MWESESLVEIKSSSPPVEQILIYSEQSSDLEQTTMVLLINSYITLPLSDLSTTLYIAR